MKKRFIEEKWIILIMFCLVICGGCLGNARGVLLDSICDDLNMNRTEYGLSGTICTLVCIVMTMFSTRIFLKIGLKRTVITGMILYIIGYLIAANATGKLMLYISYSVLGCAGCLAGTSILMIILNQWFPKEGGLAAGILSSFTGVAGALFSPIFSALNGSSGWRTVMYVCAFIIVLTFLPVILYKRSFIPVTSDEIKDEQPQEVGREISIKRVDIILLCIQHALSTYGVTVVAYLSSIAVSRGLDASKAALTVSMFMIGNLVFKVLFGPLSDRFGSSRTTLMLLTINIISCLLLMTAQSALILNIASLLFGSLYAVVSLGTSLTSKQMYGNEGYVKCIPKISIAYYISYSVFNPITGAMYDKTGSYNIMLYILTGMMFLVFFVSVLIDIRIVKSIKK